MEYPNTGFLFKKTEEQRKHPKAPLMGGSIRIDKHYLLQLIEESTDGIVEVKIDGWTAEKPDKNGNKYLSLKVNTWKPDGSYTKKTVVDEDLPF